MPSVNCVRSGLCCRCPIPCAPLGLLHPLAPVIVREGEAARVRKANPPRPLPTPSPYCTYVYLGRCLRSNLGGRRGGGARKIGGGVPSGMPAQVITPQHGHLPHRGVFRTVDDHATPLATMQVHPQGGVGEETAKQMG
eukprot:scaffold324478_cov57-Tisochrysis_lutea.AAC.1